LLLNELQPGESYEVILTPFHGLPLLRYRIGDLVTVVDLRDEEAGIGLPQIVFKARADEIIDLAGLCKLDERTLWQAIDNVGVKYVDWTACKEFQGGQSFLRLYLELKEESQAEEIARLIDEQLKAIHVSYREIEELLGLQPVRVTLLTPGTFQHYYEEKETEGASLGQLKPSHMHAPDAVIQRLLTLSQGG